VKTSVLTYCKVFEETAETYTTG